MKLLPLAVSGDSLTEYSPRSEYSSSRESSWGMISLSRPHEDGGSRWRYDDGDIVLTALYPVERRRLADPLRRWRVELT